MNLFKTVLPLALLLSLVACKSAKTPEIPEDSLVEYYKSMPNFDYVRNSSSPPYVSGELGAPRQRKLELMPNQMGGLPDDIQLQQLMDNYRQSEALNQRPEAEAADINEGFSKQASFSAPHSVRSLRKQTASTRRLQGSKEDETPAETEQQEDAGQVTEETGTSSEVNSSVIVTSGSDGSSTESSVTVSESTESIEDYIDRLVKRVHSIDDKVDHLLFHNHHDLAGMTAHYTPYGVQMLPTAKSADSVDQKLKMIDYMHNMGGGYNPMLHAMLPYYMGQTGNMGNPGIKLNGITGMDIAATGNKRKLVR